MFIADSPLNGNYSQRSRTGNSRRKTSWCWVKICQALFLFCKFLSENLFLPVNADGDMINMENISVNVGAWVIKLAADPETDNALTSIFSSYAKEERCAHIDDKS
jgi:hypothetical protein